MPQHDLDIANQSFIQFRGDLNNGLKALASNSAGSTAPPAATTQPAQFWADTAADRMRIRDEGNASLWHELFWLNTAFGGFNSANAVNGYFAFPNGIMFQWVRQDIPFNGNGGVLYQFNVGLPQSFSTVYQAVATPNAGLDTGMVCGVHSLATNSIGVTLGYPIAKNFTAVVTVFAVGVR